VNKSLVLLLTSDDLFLLLTTGIKKTSVWKTTFVLGHFDTG